MKIMHYIPAKNVWPLSFVRAWFLSSLSEPEMCLHIHLKVIDQNRFPFNFSRSMGNVDILNAFRAMPSLLRQKVLLL